MRISSCTAVLAFWLFLIVPTASSADASEDDRLEDFATFQWSSEERDVFDVLANELLDGLERVAPRIGLFSPDKPPPRVAIWPFREEDLPVSRKFAGGINNRLLASLQRKAGSQFIFVGREELGTILHEQADMSVFEDIENPVASLLGSAKAELLVMGAITVRGKNIELVYKVARIANGVIVASTRPRVVAKAKDARVPEKTLAQAVKALAGQFRERASDMEEMHLAGIGYRNSGAQSEFSSYLEGLISDETQQVFDDILTERRLTVRRAGLNRKQMQEVRRRGLTPEARIKPAQPETFDRRKGVYVLSGSYWDLGSALEIRLTLGDAAAHSISVRQVVNRASLPAGLAMKPPPAVTKPTKKHYGPIDLRLSSNRGTTPTYRIGETMDLIVDLSQGAWVHCFYQDARGAWIKMIPNEHYPTAHLTKGRHTIPGNLAEWNLRVKPPAGTEVMKCFATTRDVSGQLPPSILANDLKPLPKQLTASLAGLFHRISGGAVSEAAMVVTVATGDAQ